jgi:predicted DNA binding protein
MIEQGVGASMPNFEALLEIRHDCPYCVLTERYSGLRISSWDNVTTHVAVVISSKPEDLEAFEAELASFLPYATVNRQCCGLEIVIQNRDCDPRSVTALIASTHCWSAQPAVAEGGWERYRVFSWDKSNILNLVNLIKENGGTVRVGAMHQVGLPSFTEEMLVPVESLMAGLTDKQIGVLTSALEQGYFESPARISADEMARLAGLSRSTFMEHLRKAEGKLLSNVLPLLRIAYCDKY